MGVTASSNSDSDWREVDDKLNNHSLALVRNELDFVTCYFNFVLIAL